MFETYGDFLSVTEATQALKCSRKRIYELLEDGSIKAWKPGQGRNETKHNVWKIPKESIIDYVTNELENFKKEI